MASATAAVAAAAAFGFGEVVIGGNAAEFEGHGNEFADFALEGFQFALGVHEFDGYAVVEERIAGTFKFADLSGAELDAGVLLLMESFTAFMDGLVLKLGRVVSEELFHGFLEFVDAVVFGDFGAELQG